jgi:uncharacterized protein
MKSIDTNKFGPWAIVTGASSGIGEEFAHQLAASGLNLVLVARRLSALEALGKELAKNLGIRYRTVAVDLTSDDFLSEIEQTTHDLDIGLLISNAGAMIAGDFLSIDPQLWRQDLHLNAQVHLDLAYHFGQRFALRRRGGILLLSSTAGMQGVPFSAEYAAAKAYVLTLGEGLHIELQKVGVNVTVLLPGATDTPMLEASGFDRDKMLMKPMSTQQCVAEGLAALSANRATHVPGFGNRLIAAVMPRPLATRLFGSLTEQLMRDKSPLTSTQTFRTKQPSASKDAASM